MTPTGLKLQLRREFDREQDVLQVIGTLLRVSGKDDWHFPLRTFRRCRNVLRKVADLMLEEVSLDGYSSEELLVPVRIGMIVERNGLLVAVADEIPEDQHSEMMVV